MLSSAQWPQERLPTNYLQRSVRDENEPKLQPLTGETLKCQIAKTENNSRMDARALNFWCHNQREFFSIRVFDPVTPNIAH